MHQDGEQENSRDGRFEEFVHMLSHDLKSPVRKISSFVQFLAEDLGENVDANVLSHIRFIQESSQQLQSLIDSLIDLSEVTTQKGPWKTVDIRECVDTAVTTLESTIRYRATQVLVEDGFPSLSCNPSLVVQVFINLIDNAIKYGPEQPEVHVTVAQRACGTWVFGVRDGGPGIAPEARDLIFLPLRRVASAQLPGVGMGLTICQKAVHHHGGDIWVDSQSGGGSHFMFTLSNAGNIGCQEVPSCDVKDPEKT